MTLPSRCSLVAGLLLAAQVGPAAAQTLEEGTESEPVAASSSARPLETERDPWRIEFTPWIWLMGIDGDVGVGPVTARVSQSFVDILGTSDSIFAFAGRLEVAHERIGFFLDGFFADLGVEDESGPPGIGDVDVEFEQGMLDFALMYRMIERQSDAGATGRGLSLDVYAGGRYSSLDLTIDPKQLASESRGDQWVDPIIGTRVILPLGESWHVMVAGDIGGFGVSSDLTWGATGTLGHDFSLFGLPATASIGYRAIAWDYEGDGERRFHWDVVQHGLILGLTLRF
ncbi:MAG: hypothetical protein SFZ24_04985 [Planctomycetota bacterium]|nr:hypothetical protein [Planctomycetota bacterium]